MNEDKGKGNAGGRAEFDNAKIRQDEPWPEQIRRVKKETSQTPPPPPPPKDKRGK